MSRTITKKLTGGKSVSSLCANNNWCPVCYGNRTHKHRRAEPLPEIDEVNEWDRLFFYIDDEDWLDTKSMRVEDNYPHLMFRYGEPLLRQTMKEYFWLKGYDDERDNLQDILNNWAYYQNNPTLEPILKQTITSTGRA